MTGIGGPYIAVLRPLNGSMAAAAVVIGSIIENTAPSTSGIWAIILLSVSAFLVTGGGNVLNDITDTEIDRIAHPERPLASGEITVEAARKLLAFVLTSGILASSIASILINAALPVILVLISLGIIILYERTFKRYAIAGNLAVGVLTGMPFLLGASVGGFSSFVIAVFLMAFLSNTSREVIKDIEDMRMDEGHRSTMALKYGKRSAAMVGVVIMALAVISSIIPVIIEGPDMPYVLGIGFADSVLVLSAVRSMRDPATGQRLSKVGMLAAMGVFLVISL